MMTVKTNDERIRFFAPQLSH